MKKIELLAPCGNMDMLVASIQAGCDAVYLGGDRFGARAYSKNFSNDEIVEAIKYAHLYGVKVYVTVNTLIYENEVDDFLNFISFLHKNNVDAVLIQDLGMFDLVRKTFPNLDIHSSTQMHIHNLDGTKLMEDLGAKRVVLARETSIDEIKYIKNNSSVELEVFVHGALCISYSGECLMSSLIGGRSGNRGMCAGSCRLKYDVIDKFNNKLNNFDYPLSTKDLNSLEYVGELIDSGVASLKIEGRMKSLEYVYMVVHLYRMAIDSYYNNHKVIINKDELLKLKKIFNRNYTKGFLFNTDNNDIINGYRPNHMGVSIGKIIDYDGKMAKIILIDNLSIGSGLRVIGKKNDVGINVNEFYINNKLVKNAYKGDIISIKVNSDVNINDNVVITLDSSINNEIEKIINSKPRKVLINGKFIGKCNHEMVLSISDNVNTITVNGNIVSKAINSPSDYDMIYNKLSRLGDTIYDFNKLDIDIDDDIFISIKDINDLRRKAILLLNEKRLYKYYYVRNDYYIDVCNFKKERLLNAMVMDMNSYNKLDKKYDFIYSYLNIPGTIKKYPRVIRKYDGNFSDVMIGEVGGLYKNKNVCCDFSLNVVNSYTVAFLHSLGAKRITLSYELNDDQIKDIIDNYHKRYGVHPNLELIIRAYEEVMISKFSLNKYYNNDDIYLLDMFHNKYKVKTIDNLMYIYNYKLRDNMNKMNKYYDMGINSLRINMDI